MRSFDLKKFVVLFCALFCVFAFSATAVADYSNGEDSHNAGWGGGDNTWANPMDPSAGGEIHSSGFTGDSGWGAAGGVATYQTTNEYSHGGNLGWDYSIGGNPIGNGGTWSATLTTVDMLLSSDCPGCSDGGYEGSNSHEFYTDNNFGKAGNDYYMNGSGTATNDTNGNTWVNGTGYSKYHSETHHGGGYSVTVPIPGVGELYQNVRMEQHTDVDSETNSP